MCLIASVIALPIGVFSFHSLSLSDYLIMISAVLSSLILVLLAPVGTVKRPVFSEKHRNFLRKKLLSRLIILWVIILLNGHFIEHSVSFGIILIAISVLTQKLMGGLVNED